jgi:tRNA(Ile)-lysidine synthase
MDIVRISEEEKTSIEATARKYRYAFLERVRVQVGANYILTAHHLDDRIETTVFNLIRGTKLGGIHALAELQNHLFRPLLSVSKSEILDYATMHNITYREDSTNTDTDYLRNKIRKDILPEFATINPNYRQNIREFIDYTEDLKDWIDTSIAQFLSRYPS